MKRTLLVVLAATMGFSTMGVAIARTVATPEVDAAGSNFALGAVAPPTQTQCVGEDGGPYNTVVGIWKGAAMDTSPGAGPDVPLTGKLKVSAKFTANLTTGRGVGTGKATLTKGGNTVFAGKFNMVIQILNSNQDVGGRGLLLATLINGDTLVANFEILLNGATGGITGNIDGGPSFPDFSAEWNGTTC